MRHLAVLLALVLSAQPVQAAPKVVASIKPVHALVAAVMQGVATPRLLVPGGQSPHAYSLKPSEASALADADLVVWAGPALESFLTRPLAGLAAGRSLALMQADGIALRPSRAGGLWGDGHDAGEAAAHDDSHDHAEHGHDPHFWLDPDNAAATVSIVAARLAMRDPVHAERYRANADAARARISRLDARLTAQLAPLRDVPFLVFHDAYQYFEAHYDLRAVGAVSLGPQRQPGARRVFEIKQRIRDAGVRCVFREPQFPPGLVATVIENTGAASAVLDPLGADLPPGPEAWFTLMDRLAANLQECLAPS